MAEKEKKSLLKILSTEYAFEGIILLVLSVIAIVLGALIIQGCTTEGANGLVVNEDFWLIGEYPKVFAWILIVLGIVSLLLAVFPYCKPSIGEVKRISWPSKKTMLENTLITVVFIFIFALLFIGYDAVLGKFVQLLDKIFNR